jgi:hypothetical protein
LSNRVGETIYYAVMRNLDLKMGPAIDSYRTKSRNVSAKIHFECKDCSSCLAKACDWFKRGLGRSEQQVAAELTVTLTQCRVIARNFSVFLTSDYPQEDTTSCASSRQNNR